MPVAAPFFLHCEAVRPEWIDHNGHAEEDYLAATCEWMSLHIDLGPRRVAPILPKAVPA